LSTSASFTATAKQFRKLPYDPVRDFTPITQIDTTSGNLLLVHPAVPARSISELIGLAKARPGEVKYASGGVGSAPHITAALFAVTAGIQLMHVPYKGTVMGLTDVVGGRVEMITASPPAAIAFVNDGRLRALGIAGPRRLPVLPQVPTIDEAGVPGFNLVSWHGMWFPAGVPSDIVRRVQAEVVKALATPEVQKQFADNFLFPAGTSPEDFAAFVRKELALQASIMKKVGIEPE
ncbi:MAG TPA: tripartite tricarboxylate transporter substrate-binding protein, partial [Burkholderiales bacterium]|nr:tripartite tricarboxylate transporter substrate-binding protein [Burkholderiales bacterium]